MNSISKLNLICPACFNKNKKEILLNSSKKGYFCKNCQRIYPLKKIVYIQKNKCQPQKCSYECKKSCKEKAILKLITEGRAYFTLNGSLKNIKRPKITIDEKCTNCGQCIKHCPFNALIAIDAPTFLISESYKKKKDNKNQNNKINNNNFSEYSLRPPLNKKEIRPIFLLLYEAIAKEIEKQKTKEIIIDNGCGANLLKEFVSDKNKIISIDINAEHNAFYPIDGIVNGENLPFQKESIDLFISTNVLEHVTRPKRYLLEINRTLKKNGKIIITIPTPWWHLSKLLSLHHQLNYLIHIIKNPLKFLKGPVKNFNLFWAHEKDCNYENAKNTKTLSKEIREFKVKQWEKLFKSANLFIDKKIGVGNIFSNNIFAVKLIKKMGNSKKRPIHLTYILKK